MLKMGEGSTRKSLTRPELYCSLILRLVRVGTEIRGRLREN
jgi:hypothetical protein